MTVLAAPLSKEFIPSEDWQERSRLLGALSRSGVAGFLGDRRSRGRASRLSRRP
jgi:hypothetical protein